MGDELGDHVDSRRVEAQRAKVVGDMARPTPQIEHRARSVRQMPPDEGQVVGMYLLACAEQLDVELRDGRICLPELLQVHHATIWALGMAEQARPARAGSTATLAASSGRGWRRAGSTSWSSRRHR